MATLARPKGGKDHPTKRGVLRVGGTAGASVGENFPTFVDKGVIGCQDIICGTSFSQPVTSDEGLLVVVVVAVFENRIHSIADNFGVTNNLAGGVHGSPSLPKLWAWDDVLGFLRKR